MRYIGGKSMLLDEIFNVITTNVNEEIKIVGDIFSGSGVVSAFFKQKGFKVISNDIMYMCYILTRGYTEYNKEPKFNIIGKDKIFEILNNISKPLNKDDAFISKNYSPNESCNRMYFQTKNANKIDGIRQQIEKWKLENKITESEYYYLLACLIYQVPFISNIAGVYGAYLKEWDKRTYNDLKITPLPIIKSRYKCKVFNMDAQEVCKKNKFDLVYIDPPYNQRQYFPNYHVLETIAKYDKPIIHGVTGMREYKRSAFCIKKTVKSAFEQLFDSINAKYAVLSYNNEGLLSSVELLNLLENYGTVRLYEIPYRRYKSKIPNNINGLMEQIYFIDLR